MKNYKPHTAPKLLKLKKEFTNLENVRQDPDKWTNELESIQVQTDNIETMLKVNSWDFMIDIMNSPSEQYNLILDNLEVRLIKKMTIQTVNSG